MKWFTDKFIPFALGTGAALVVFLGLACLSAVLLRALIDILRGMF